MIKASAATKKSGWVQASTKNTQLLEFLLVVLMLVALVLLVMYVMWMPVTLGAKGSDPVTVEAALEYRTGILTVLLTAFGAWIGAGAAYFFGSKNLQRATDAMVEVQGKGLQRLSNVHINDLPPSAVDWVAKPTTLLSELVAKLNDPDCWWFVVVDAEGKYDTVMHEEVVFRFVEDRWMKKEASDYDSLLASATVKDVVDWAKKRPDGVNKLWDIAIITTMEMSAQTADERMIGKGVHVAIITDANGTPTHAITEGDIKKALENC